MDYRFKVSIPAEQNDFLWYAEVLAPPAIEKSGCRNVKINLVVPFFRTKSDLFFKGKATQRLSLNCMKLIRQGR